jgi:uncharacterized repeat protein (TIGR03803 family)
MISPTPARSLFCQVCTLSLSAMLTLLIAALPAGAQTYTVIHNFSGQSDGAYPQNDLVQDADGNLYGAAQEGGAFGAGAVYKMDTSGAVTILYSFTNGDDGGFPEAGLFRDIDGTLYGTTTGGTEGLGTVFKLDTNNVLTTLHTFGGGADGAEPEYRLVSINGELYGTTNYGGDSSCKCGTIFKVTKGGRETVLHRFVGADGAQPQGLIRDSAGNLYGAAATNDNSVGDGTIFKLDPAGVFSVLYTFTSGADGGLPQANLILDANGNIHGVTETGGDPRCQCGVVFRLDAAGQETVLHTFYNFGGGGQPFATGLLDVGGVLYGTTVSGGDPECNCGVIFQIGRTGQYTVLHRFGGLAAEDGNAPVGGHLILGLDGNLYGASGGGGTGTCSLEIGGPNFGCGTVFKYTP